jgi:hypothetical protein
MALRVAQFLVSLHGPAFDEKDGYAWAGTDQHQGPAHEPQTLTTP